MEQITIYAARYRVQGYISIGIMEPVEIISKAAFKSKYQLISICGMEAYLRKNSDNYLEDKIYFTNIELIYMARNKCQIRVRPKEFKVQILFEEFTKAPYPKQRLSSMCPFCEKEHTSIDADSDYDSMIDLHKHGYDKNTGNFPVGTCIIKGSTCPITDLEYLIYITEEVIDAK